MSTYVSIERDPFARGDYVRLLVPRGERRPCTWCGSRPGRFRYGWSPDSIGDRTHIEDRAFCSRSCWRCDQ